MIGSVGLHLGFLAAGATFGATWRWAHEPFHAAIEVLGASIALAIVPLLLSQERRGTGTAHNRIIAHALAGMGLLDGMHAAVHVGNTFVWLHSLATLVGGLLFALTWLPHTSSQRRAPVSRTLFAAGAAGVLSILFPELAPTMVENGRFTTVAVVMNVGGGALLFAAAWRMYRTWRNTGNEDDLLFVVHCALFGAAAVMFEQSQLWDVPWWGWHLLRLLAYGVALVYVVRSLRLEEELTRRGRALERANDELEHFVHSASHDLQEPLRMVASYSSMLEQEYADRLDEQGLRWLQHARTGATRMQSLVRDLLDYSKVDSTATPLEPVPLRAVIADVLENLQPSIADRGATIEVDDDLPHVMGDRGQLVQVLQNVVGNAVKYCDTAPVVRVSCTRLGSQVRIDVDDNGIGVSEEFHERAFIPFKRLVPRSRFPGTGLGLAIARRIIDRHQGRIWMQSHEGGAGTRVSFTLQSEAS